MFQTKAFPVYFVTFCTHRRARWLAAVDVHDAFVRFAEIAEIKFNIAVGRYVIMPEHVHLLVCGDQSFVLEHWVGELKQALARGGKRKRADGQIWQEGFFDHVLRSNESMSAKWEYVRMNPVRAGLVTRAEDWPYQGEIIPLDRA
ncbi:MAG: REP-associated tyrosine transposase [Chthoniobacterales bacterium]